MALTDAEQRELLTNVRAIFNALPILQEAHDAAVNFAWQGHRQLGVTNGQNVGEDGKTIPAGKPLSFVDWCVQKFGKA